jgi:hypothetical protein
MAFCLFYGHLVYFVAIWYTLWLLGIFFPFWDVVRRKIWQPWSLIVDEREAVFPERIDFSDGNENTETLSNGVKFNFKKTVSRNLKKK